MEAQRDIQELEELGEQRDTRHESVSQRSLQTHNGSIFQCDHCYKIYPIISKLRDHMAQAHLSLVRFKCGMCSFLSYHRAHMKQHWHSVHSGPPIISDLEFPCEICSKKLGTEGSLRKHISHRHSDLLQCPLCVESTISLSVEALRVHFLSLHGMEPWENHQFAKYTKVRQQISKINQDPKNNKYFCFVCKANSFPFRCKLLTHVLQTHYKIYPFDCKLCLFQTSERKKIQKHYLVDHPRSEFRDLIVNKVDLFRKQKKVSSKRKKRHGKNSTAEQMENIVMEFKSDSNSSEMISEETTEQFTQVEEKSERLHDEICDETTSKCKICRVICSTKHGPYREHIRPVHGNTEYRFQCVHCDVKMYNMGALKYHIQTKHINPLERKNKIKSECQFCFKIMNPDSDMETHVKENHSSDLGCVECGEMFTNIGLLRDHVTIAHGFQKYVEWIKDKIYEAEKRVEDMNESQVTCYICNRITSTFHMKSNLKHHILNEHFQVKRIACKFCSHECVQISTMCIHIEKRHNEGRKCAKMEDLRNYWEPKIPGQENIAESQIPIESLTKVESEELMEQDGNKKLAYRCPKCSYTSINTTSDLDLKLHLQMNHFTQEQIASPALRYFFPCNICNTNCWSQNNLDIHTAKNHSLEICCPICNTIVSVDDVNAHFETLHGEFAWLKHLNAIEDQIEIKVQNLNNYVATGLVRCSICAKDFKTKDSLLSHVLVFHFIPRNRLKCKQCSFVCMKNSSSTMIDHIIKYHSGKIPIFGAETILYTENGTIDQRNERTNTEKTELSSTRTASSEERTDKSFVCSKNSTVKKGHAVKKHSTSNIPILGAETIFYTEKSSIDQRSKSLNTKILEVSSTRAMNSKELPNDCSERNTIILGAQTIFYRINHPIDQRNESPSKLEVCSTRTASSEEHSIECYICGQELCNENALKSHIEEMHSDISLPYFCQLCHEFFTHEFSFETHWYLAHCETQPLHSRLALQSKSVSFQRAFLSRFPCKFCNTYFATEAELALHAQNVEVHPNIFLCSMCKFSSESSQAVRAHIKVKHPSYNAQNLTELRVVDVTTPVVRNKSIDLNGQVSSNTQSTISQSESTPDLTTPSCSNPVIKVEPLDLQYNTVTDCPGETAHSEFYMKQEMDVDEITIKEEDLTTFSDQSSHESMNRPGILERSKDFTAYSTQVSHYEKPTPGFHVLKFEPVEFNDASVGVEVRRDSENIVENAGKEIQEGNQVEKITMLPEPLFPSQSTVKEEAQIKEAVMKIRQTSKTELGYPCFACKKHKQDKPSLLRHVLWDHLRVEQYECRYCSVRFFMRKSAIAHHGEEHSERPTGCVTRFPWIYEMLRTGVEPLLGQSGGVEPPRGEQSGGVEPPQRGQGHVVGRCKRKVGGTKGGQRGREDSRNIHPRGDTSQEFAKKSRPDHVQEAVSHPTPALTCLTGPVYSGTSSACCSPDLLAGSLARGRRVTSRPYPDSLPPVPGGCLPCSVQL